MNEQSRKPTLTILVVGAGGIASYLLPPLIKTLDHQSLFRVTFTLFDGDLLEERNLDRQLFSAKQVGQHKASALTTLLLSNKAPTFDLEYCNIYVDADILADFINKHVTVTHSDDIILIISCADNNKARVDCLETLDDSSIPVEIRTHMATIIAGNETNSAEAYITFASMQSSPAHPFQIYPKMTDDDHTSPLDTTGCQAEATLDDKPQLPIANFKAATAVLHLFNAWFLTQNGHWDPWRKEEKNQLESMPWHITYNEYHILEKIYGDYCSNTSELNCITA